MSSTTASSPWRAWLGLAVALVGLNLAWSFHNLWPTPWITTRHELSVEIAVLVLLLALAVEFGRQPSRTALRWLAVLVVLLAVARYMEVTAPALYGRRINLYWDAQYIPHVTAMLVEAMPTWQVWLLSAGALALLAGLYTAARWLLTLLVDSLSDRPRRRATLMLTGFLVAAYGVNLAYPPAKTRGWFSLPVSATYAHQIKIVHDAVAGDPSLDTTADPLPSSNLGRLGGADVLVLFLESYGAATLDRDEFRHALAGARQHLANAIEQSGHAVVSARVRSPTFGGGSWRAHSTFLSGIEIADNHRYQLLLTRQRDNLIQRFAAEGYRTVGVMPGLKRAWPEGAFYGYDTIYDAAALDYTGPAFGWWRIPDQYALARFDALEVDPPQRAPLMAVMTTITSHAPFRSVPPYRPDWQSLLGAQPYPTDADASDDPPRDRGNDMSDDYLAAIDYALTYIAGYLTHRSGDDWVLIVIGDHQPPARVSGPNASWDVPVHAITGNAALISTLETQGFVRGLEPNKPAIGPMHGLAARLLQTFDDSATPGPIAVGRGRPTASSSSGRLPTRIDIARSGIER